MGGRDPIPTPPPDNGADPVGIRERIGHGDPEDAEGSRTGIHRWGRGTPMGTERNGRWAGVAPAPWKRDLRFGRSRRPCGICIDLGDLRRDSRRKWSRGRGPGGTGFGGPGGVRQGSCFVGASGPERHGGSSAGFGFVTGMTNRIHGNPPTGTRSGRWGHETTSGEGRCSTGSASFDGPGEPAVSGWTRRFAHECGRR